MKKKLLMLAATILLPALWARSKQKRSAQKPREALPDGGGLPQPRYEA